jgi:carbon monoxide dehydrogenase subunit G
MPAAPFRFRAIFALATCAAAAAFWPAPPAGAQELTLETYRRGDAFLVWAETELQVDLRVAWDVLSDYDHMSQFIPGMSASRVLSRSGDTLLVEQKGEFAFFFFRQPIEVKLEIVEVPLSRIVARSIGGGSFLEMTGRYDLEKSDDGVKITYTGRFVPNFSLPPFLGVVAVRHTAATRFAAIVAEIQRRDALAKAGARPW